VVERGGQLDSYDTDSLIGVLEQLARVYAGHKVVLLWDGLSAHWSQKMRAHLEQQRDWLTVERLPAYAPELNAVEYLWANCGPGDRKQRDHPYRIDLLRVSCPLGTIVPVRAIGPGARMGVMHAHRPCLGRS
jgi:transposase